MRRHILPILALAAIAYAILLANGSNFVPALVPVTAVCGNHRTSSCPQRQLGCDRTVIVALCMRPSRHRHPRQMSTSTGSSPTKAPATEPSPCHQPARESTT